MIQIIDDTRAEQRRRRGKSSGLVFNSLDSSTQTVNDDVVLTLQ